MAKAIDILLVEDSETDAELTLEALQQGKLKNSVQHVKDGAEALRYLFQQDEYTNVARPDLILLDLNMPGVDGHEVLRIIQQDEKLSLIPVVVLTTSVQDKDILTSYGLNANNYVVKPVDLDDFFRVVQSIENFWVEIVSLPPLPKG
jgi:CheY-like chemotaxis protein